MSEAQKGLLAAAEVVKVVDLVGYQDGAVVSRVVLMQKGGNVPRHVPYAAVPSANG